jgi:hypothetical protein
MLSYVVGFLTFVIRVRFTAFFVILVSSNLRSIAGNLVIIIPVFSLNVFVSHSFGIAKYLVIIPFTVILSVSVFTKILFIFASTDIIIIMSCINLVLSVIDVS